MVLVAVVLLVKRSAGRSSTPSKARKGSTSSVVWALTAVAMLMAAKSKPNPEPAWGWLTVGNHGQTVGSLAWFPCGEIRPTRKDLRCEGGLGRKKERKQHSNAAFCVFNRLAWHKRSLVFAIERRPKRMRGPAKERPMTWGLWPHLASSAGRHTPIILLQSTTEKHDPTTVVTVMVFRKLPAVKIRE